MRWCNKCGWQRGFCKHMPWTVAFYPNAERALRDEALAMVLELAELLEEPR